MNKTFKLISAVVAVLLVAVAGRAYWAYQQTVVIQEKEAKIATSNVVPVPDNDVTKKKDSVPFQSVGVDKEFTLGEKFPRSSIQGDNIENNAGKFSGRFNWGGGTPYLFVTSTTKKDVAPVDCEYGCTNTVILQLSYYLLQDNDIEKIFTEEIDVSKVKSISYVPLSPNWSSDMKNLKISFLQSINEQYCCDGSGSVRNRIFEVDYAKNKTVVREISS